MIERDLPGKYLLKESKMGSSLSLDYLFYEVWISGNALIPLSLVREQLIDNLLCTETTAARIVSESIPELIKLGLGSVLFTPFLAFGSKPDFWIETY